MRLLLQQVFDKASIQGSVVDVLDHPRDGFDNPPSGSVQPLSGDEIDLLEKLLQRKAASGLREHRATP